MQPKVQAVLNSLDDAGLERFMRDLRKGRIDRPVRIGYVTRPAGSWLASALAERQLRGQQPELPF